MHELAVCQDIMQQVTQLAARHKAKSVSLIRLQIGPLSGIEAPLLETAFTIARAGSIAEYARLAIETLAVKVYCPECASESVVSADNLCCAQCGNWQTRLLQGDEMILRQVEMDMDDVPDPDISTSRH